MTTAMHIETAEIVLDFIQSLNAEDFEKARTYLADDMKFIGVMGSRDGADTYIADMAKMKFKYSVKKVFADEGDVSMFYDINMGDVTTFSSGLYHLENGKIKTFNVLFDPRPVLEKSKKK